MFTGRPGIHALVVLVARRPRTVGSHVSTTRPGSNKPLIEHCGRQWAILGTGPSSIPGGGSGLGRQERGLLGPLRAKEHVCWHRPVAGKGTIGTNYGDVEPFLTAKPACVRGLPHEFFEEVSDEVPDKGEIY